MYRISPDTIHTFTIQQEIAPTRIDMLITQEFPEYSRSFFQRLIKNEHITCNNKIVTKPSMLVQAGDTVSVHFPPHNELRSARTIPPELTVEVLYQHPDFLIINKPAGLIVHDASPYHTEPTLVDWLIEHFKEISDVGSYDRPGIVHRLDKDTSGIMIVARTNYAHTFFGNMFRERSIKKEYIAVVEGHPNKQGSVDFPIGRDQHKRNKMTHKNLNGRHATTHYTVFEYYQHAAQVLAQPVTGRTHQIRVHLAAIGHPIIGDTVYGSPSKQIKRHALHAHTISFTYQEVPFTFLCKLPNDMQDLIAMQKKQST